MEANRYLKGIQTQLQTHAAYFGSDKKRFQIEVNEKVRVSNKFEISSNRKGYKRYVTADTKVSQMNPRSLAICETSFVVFG